MRTLRRRGAPDALYLDNGATSRGEILRTVCALGISLLYTRPYDAPARGKMERFWRTPREGCLDFVGSVASLHDLNVRLWAFLDEHYHRAPHATRVGRSPETVYGAACPGLDALDEQRLRGALTVRVRRRVRCDSTVPLDGQLRVRPELPHRTARHGHPLAGRPRRPASERHLVPIKLNSNNPHHLAS